MKGDLLLYWLSHRGSGSWAALKQAAAQLAAEDTDVRALCRDVSRGLSELGHVDIFIEGSDRWKVRQPVLGGLCHRPGTAVLCGARSPGLLRSLEESAAVSGCRLVVDPAGDLPAEVRLEGSSGSVASAAAAAELLYVPDLAAVLCSCLVPLLKQLETASEDVAMHNWSTRSFDLTTQRWVEGILPKTAQEYESRYGVRRYLVETRHRKLVRMSRREAVYAAAAQHRKQLAIYDPTAGQLTVPDSAPLPDGFARAACLSSGRRSRFEGGRIVYPDVPPDIAALLLVTAGQPHPGVRWRHRAG